VAECSELAVLINDAALNLAARSDITGIEGITKILKKDMPTIGRNDVVDAIVAANRRTTTAERTALQNRIAKIKDEARENVRINKAVAEIEESLSAGTLPETVKRKSKRVTKEIKNLRIIRDELRKQLEQSSPAIRKRMELRLTKLNDILSGKVKITPRDKQIIPSELRKLENEIRVVSKKITDKRVIKNLNSKVAELRKHLKAGTLPSSKKTVAEAATNASRARQTIKDLRQQLRNSEPAKIERVQKQIEFLNARIASGIKLPEPRVITRGSEELEQFRFQRDQLRGEINARIQDLKPRTIFQKFVQDPLDLSRAVLTSHDVSAVSRQGKFIAFGNPKIAFDSQKPMFQALVSEKNALKIQKSIVEGRVNSVIYKRSKLHLGELNASLSKAEEAIQSDLLGKIARSGKAGKRLTASVRGSNRAFTVYLNKLRADTFDMMTRSLTKNGTPTQGEMEAIANFVNVATGRGSLGKFENAAQGLNAFFFAPRYVASRFQLLTGMPIFKKGAGRARKLIIKEYAKSMTGIGMFFSMIAMGKLAYDLSDDDVSVETNPLSSDWMKIRIGNTRIDPMAGLSQTTVVLSRVIVGKTKSLSTGKTTNIRRVGFGRTDAFGYVLKFGRFKLAPGPSALATFISGENAVGETATLFGEDGTESILLDLVIPMSLGEIRDSIVEQGVPLGTAISLAALFGDGVQNFKATKERKRPER